MKKVALLVSSLAFLAWFGNAQAKHHKAAVDPTLGADCGTGASMVGSASVMRITTGTGFGRGGTCTVSFSPAFTNVPVCNANNETHGNAGAIAIGCAGIDTSTIELQDESGAKVDGDVLAVVVASF